MNEASPVIYHGDSGFDEAGGIFFVQELTPQPIDILQINGGPRGRRWHPRKAHQPPKPEIAFGYDSDDSSLSSSGSGSNKSSEKGENKNKRERDRENGTVSHERDRDNGIVTREWRGRGRRDLRPRRPGLEHYFSANYPFQVRFTPDDLLNGSRYDSLSQEMWDKFMRSQQTEETFRKKMNLWRYLFMTIKSIFPRYGLYVVGSTMSGFGLDSSDMDLCLYVRALVDVEPREHALLHLNLLLSYIKSFDPNAEVIHAKVPILKFRDARNGLQVDLNCNNVVGIRNTNLLYCYSRMDWRVRPLVAAMKLWARSHKINDARRRTLSSYALTLMVIHFLQCGTSPAVLPRAGESPRRAHNRMPLGALFLQMLKYYADFPYEQMAISVRAARRVPVWECRARAAATPGGDPAHWKLLCVEEPFDLTNTARTVYDPLMFEKIVETFRTSHKRLAASLRLRDAWPQR
ncbi:poly(A) RNA polymerase gld-2 homolog A-like [Maniola jurtina]|uniref:poly(A) RNA polymerase gld-2 homolog A-like n=1 Tax=Maniola jurtina TaxID=191418 RepID=UPI001E68DD60|nr:poly(A) RNA polymerase gld-2 homolog A-like [Maniola jurtina]